MEAPQRFICLLGGERGGEHYKQSQQLLNGALPYRKGPLGAFAGELCLGIRVGPVLLSQFSGDQWAAASSGFQRKGGKFRAKVIFDSNAGEDFSAMPSHNGAVGVRFVTLSTGVSASWFRSFVQQKLNQ